MSELAYDCIEIMLVSDQVAIDPQPIILRGGVRGRQGIIGGEMSSTCCIMSQAHAPATAVRETVAIVFIVILFSLLGEGEILLFIFFEVGATSEEYL